METQLVFLPRGVDKEPFTTSDLIAEYAEVKYRAVQQLIQKYQNDLEELGIIAFEMRKLGGRGRPKTVYHLNEQQATLLITYLKNTKPVRAFKKELVRQFYAMRERVAELSSPMWQSTRTLGKEVRRRETGAIKLLVDYATEQGSRNAEHYYRNLSTLADHAVGITDRDQAGVIEFNELLTVEKMICQEIQAGIEAGMHYKDVYRACKDRLMQYRRVIA